MKTRAILLQASGQEHLCVEPGSCRAATLEDMCCFGEGIQNIHIADYVKVVRKQNKAGLTNGFLQRL